MRRLDDSVLLSLKIALGCVVALAGGVLLRSLRPSPPAAAPVVRQAISTFFEPASVVSHQWLDQVAAGGGSQFTAGTHHAILSPDGSHALELRVVTATGEVPVVKLWLAQRVVGTLQAQRLVETPHALAGAYALSCAPTPQVWSHDGQHVALVWSDGRARAAAAYTDLEGKVTTLPPARDATLAPSFHPARPQVFFVDTAASGYDVRVHDLATGTTTTVHTRTAGTATALVASPSSLHLAWLHDADEGDRSTAKVAVCDVDGADPLFAEGVVFLPKVGVEEPLLRWTPDGRWLVYIDNTARDVCAFDSTTRRTDRVADGTWRIAGTLDGLLQLHRAVDGKTAFLPLDRPVSPDGPPTLWIRLGAAAAPYPALVRQRVGEQAIMSWSGALRWWAPGDRDSLEPRQVR